MKSLKTYISEKLKINKNFETVKCFIYELHEKDNIKIFDGEWVQFKEYKNKVYINNENIVLDSKGYTLKKFEPGTYEVEIKNINEVNNCRFMFYNCTYLIEVPMFDISKVSIMAGMFAYCERLEYVPDLLYDITDFNKYQMGRMFANCNNLSEETKQIWSKVYDFKKNHKIMV